MSVIGGILLFVAGMLTGGGAVIFNRRCVQRETEPLRAENNKLWNIHNEDEATRRADYAYRKGYSAGRKNPISDVERLADTIERHNIDFRTNRRE